MLFVGDLLGGIQSFLEQILGFYAGLFEFFFGGFFQ